MNDNPSTSYKEVERILAPRIAQLHAGTKYAEYEEPTSPPIRTIAVVGDKDFAQNLEPRSAAALTDITVKFLRSILEHPDFGVSAHYDAIDVSRGKGNSLLAELKRAGCITVHERPSNSRKGGRGRLVPTVTRLGAELLQAYDDPQTHT